MRIPKQYGSYRRDKCPFCEKQGTTTNEQGVPVCKEHKTEMLDLKCACGGWLDIRTGKYGAYCHCMNCGNVNMARALSMNTIEAAPKPEEHATKSEITINSNDPDYFS